MGTGVDIGVWLRGLGLEQYEQAFRDNDVDFGVLGRLTIEDLREIGIASVGHRRRLLQAIADLGPFVGPSSDRSGERSAAVAPGTRAERRQLTVMFIDLVGSTTLAQSLDPEDLRHLIGCYHDACTSVIVSFEGFVAKYLGDGVLAYFGWPRTYEDEALLAVHAGIAIAEAVAKIATPGGSLAARVGIATGLVVVGDLLGEGAAREEAVIGETPNLAARLQQIAAPGTVVIAESTRRLLGGVFELEDLGEQTVRGLARPVGAWRAVKEIPSEGRFEARRAAGLTPLAGREREIALLLDRWELAEGGEGQVVLLVGEAGIGKSRITEALRERLGERVYTVLRLQCSPQRMESLLYPIIAQLEHAANIRREDDTLIKLEKLEGILAREMVSAVPLLAALLGIPTDGRYPSLALTPQQQKAKTLETLVSQVEAMAAQRPVLLVFEDLHWIDPTSLDLLGMLVDRLSPWPMLAVLTFRPEFESPWAGRAHVTMLGLNRLGRKDAATLATRVVGSKALPAEVLDQILARTDGIPLFLEELTKAVLESGLLEEEADRYLLRGPLPPLAIPTTLYDSLMARLDRLAPVKEVAQLAACIGREFSYDMLAAVSPLADDALTDALYQLAASELILRTGMPGSASYTFRHALVQEAAYQSLLKSKRQELHGRIAQGVEASFPEIVDLQPEWLAHHYMEAGLVELAADHWLKAAHRAKAVYALSEAAAHLDRCLVALSARPIEIRRLPEFPYLERHREALFMLGDVSSLKGDVYSANGYYERALGLAADAETRIWIENKKHRPHTVARAGARIAFYEHGSGPNTLMFVAPLAYGLAAIQPVLERLCQDFRIVTVDPRGSGASDPLTRPYPLDEHLKDVRAIIAALGDQPVVGVGISRFGNLLLKLAHSEPQLFEKLITIGTPPGDNSKRFFPDWYIDAVEKGRETEDIEHLIRSHTELLYSEPEMRELQEQTIRNRLLLPRETILSFFDPDPDIDLIMLTLGEIRVPTLVTHGRDDRLVAFAAAEEFAARLPNARLCPFEGKGHLPIFTATDEFCEVLRSFVLADNAQVENCH